MLVLRERAAGTYHASAYFLAKNLAEFLFQLPAPILFSCIVYWLIGLAPTAGQFFVFTAFMVLGSVAATSMALMVSALARTTDLAVTILPMSLEVFRLFGGFFLPPASLPNYYVWLDALSYVKYAYTAISQSQLSGMMFTCGPADTNCILEGQQMINQRGLDYISVGGCAGVLIAMTILYRLIAYLGVRFIKW
jgi:ATP-binding cassette subfamily G (WHITE) protein 2